jgi:hypothetical protein
MIFFSFFFDTLAGVYDVKLFYYYYFAFSNKINDDVIIHGMKIFAQKKEKVEFVIANPCRKYNIPKM